MSHGIEDNSGMAYVGERPWHKLGNKLEKGANLATWAVAAGMDWRASFRPITADVNGKHVPIDGRKAIVRMDTDSPLAIVSDRYKIVQPSQILGFFADLTEMHGWHIETAGCLFGGKKLWAMAETGDGFELPGGDKVERYILLSTSLDGTTPTMARDTSVRVVCNNTLGWAESVEGKRLVRVRHSTPFDAKAVKVEMGLMEDTWTDFHNKATSLSKTKLTPSAVDAVLTATFGDPTKAPEDQDKGKRIIANVRGLYEGGGDGALMPSASGTAWGLLNAVTQYVDHEGRARSDEQRFASAEWGAGSRTKDAALANILKLVGEGEGAIHMQPDTPPPSSGILDDIAAATLGG